MKELKRFSLKNVSEKFSDSQMKLVIGGRYQFGSQPKRVLSGYEKVCYGAWGDHCVCGDRACESDSECEQYYGKGSSCSCPYC